MSDCVDTGVIGMLARVIRLMFTSRHVRSEDEVSSLLKRLIESEHDFGTLEKKERIGMTLDVRSAIKKLERILWLGPPEVSCSSDTYGSWLERCLELQKIIEA